MIMAPSLMRGDLVVIDFKSKPMQGQLVCVMAAPHELTQEWPAKVRPSPQKLPTFRRRFCFAGIEIFLAEETGNISRMMDYGESWPVVGIEADELSNFARVPRPAELECRATAAGVALRIIEGDGFSLVRAGRDMGAARREARAYLRQIQKELADYRERWDAMAAPRTVRP